MALEISGAEEARSVLSLAAPSLPPQRITRDLLAAGVCVRCIFRLSGIVGYAYESSSVITPSALLSFTKEQGQVALVRCSSPTVLDSAEKQSYCCICLGILHFDDHHTGGVRTCEETPSSIDFVSKIVKLVNNEAHDLDGFMLEVSIPPVVAANERAIWLYLKQNYGSEEWFRDKYPLEHISVKDALRQSITNPIEKQLGVSSSVGLLRIRMTYTHSDSSTKLQNTLAKETTWKKRKSGTNGGGDANENESDAVTWKILNAMQDDFFCEHFVLPPEKVHVPCQITTTCYRLPIYIGGRYLKYSRKVSQSCWIIDDERMGEASVEEIIGKNTLLVCRGDNYKFHAAGREDIDVRMLGSGRPFLVEVSNARHVPSTSDLQQIDDRINNSDNKYVAVKNLNLVGREIWAVMREGEAEKQKQYAALVWISRPLTEEDLMHISSIKELEIEQRTPIRVLHRRSPMERKRIVHWMRAEKIDERSQYFLLYLCTQAGTYIKEFVHGDLGRTNPSIGSILGCKAEILQLDVTDVKMDLFD